MHKITMMTYGLAVPVEEMTAEKDARNSSKPRFPQLNYASHPSTCSP